MNSKRIKHYPITDRYGLLSKDLTTQVAEGTLDGIKQLLKQLETRGY